jgi:hypothetical protein
MTSPSTGSRGDRPTQHIEIEELAEAAEGLVDAERVRLIEDHLAGGAVCAADAEALTEVHRTLGSAPDPPMPDDVFDRLQSVVADEQRLRTTPAGSSPSSRSHTVGDGAAPGTNRYAADHPAPGRLSSDDRATETATSAKPPLAERYSDLTGAMRSHGSMPTARAMRAKFAGGALAATLLAGTAGFGGYVASAAAGTDEPPADSPVVVASDRFEQAAGRLWQQDLGSYRFTRAWSCAREATDGRIAGIRAGVLNGEPGYLVFLQQQDRASAVFVTGCDTATPLAGPSAALPDR